MWSFSVFKYVFVSFICYLWGIWSLIFRAMICLCFRRIFQNTFLLISSFVQILGNPLKAVDLPRALFQFSPICLLRMAPSLLLRGSWRNRSFSIWILLYNGRWEECWLGWILYFRWSEVLFIEVVYQSNETMGDNVGRSKLGGKFKIMVLDIKMLGFQDCQHFPSKDLVKQLCMVSSKVVPFFPLVCWWAVCSAIFQHF